MKSVSFERGVQEFFNYCKVKNLSPHTLIWYKGRLSVLRRWFTNKYPEMTPGEVTISELREFIKHCIETVAPKTVNHTVTAVKKFFSFLNEEGYIETNPASRLEKVKAPRVLIKPFTQEQVTALLAAPNKGRFSGIRDYTLMLLLLDTGLRISEALDLTLDNIDWQSCTVKVMGKGSKERIVPFGRNVGKALREYLLRRGEDNTCPYLFLNEYAEKLSKRVIQENMGKYGTEAKITGVRVSPHTCRHFAAISYLRNGGSVFHLQKLLGHASLDICRIYLSLADQDMISAHSTCSPLDNMLAVKPEPSSSKRTRLK